MITYTEDELNFYMYIRDVRDIPPDEFNALLLLCRKYKIVGK